MGLSLLNEPVTFYQANESAKKILPKLQVFEKDHYYFALDNNCLKLYQSLERDGQVEQIIADLVPKQQIPKIVYQQTLAEEEFVPRSDPESSDDEVGDSDIEAYQEYMSNNLVCNVCDRVFHGVKELTEHQTAKKHFACPHCRKPFQSSLVLEQHRTETEHWSDLETDD